MGESKEARSWRSTHQAVRLPSMHHHLQVSGLALQIQPENHTAICLRTMSLGCTGEWIGVEVEGSGGENNAEPELTGCGTGWSKRRMHNRLNDG